MKFDFSNQYVFVFLGTNDICITKDISCICETINETISLIRGNNPKKVIFLNLSNVNGRMDRDNNFINVCKKYFQKQIQADHIVNLDSLNDIYGCLNREYTDDGLHLNEKGYEILKNIMERELKNVSCGFCNRLKS